MKEEKFVMFQNRLVKVFRHLGKQARKAGIGCYRVYDHDLPEFPFSIEVYGPAVYVAEYQRRHGLTDEEYQSWISQSVQVISDTLGVPVSQVHLRLRKRVSDRSAQYRKVDSAGENIVVEEAGLKFIVNLTDYLDTGLFLDHRITRSLVRDQSEAANVLNLFAYTGSFSVYAAAGGAANVVTVDLSNTYLNWARRNMALNGFEDEVRYTFVKDDVFAYLERIPSQFFDIIVMDPPTFSNSKMMEDVLDIQRDHVRLINGALLGLKPGGRLYFSTNLRSFKPDLAAIKASPVKDITRATTPFDFEGRFARWCFLITA